MEWTKADTLKFIELWQGFPCLWNTKDVNYKHRQKRRDASSHLAQEMGTDTFAIDKKVISLKTQYNREINKLRTKSGAGLDDIPHSNWYAFEHLTFLKDINVPRPSTDSLMLSQTEDAGQETVDIDRTEVEDRPQSSLQQSQIKSASKRKLDLQVGTLGLLKDASNAIITRQKKDNFSAFGEVIASELREIKCKRSLLYLKKRIMQLVYETKLEFMDAEDSTNKENIQNTFSSVSHEVEIEVEEVLNEESGLYYSQRSKE